MTRLRSLSGSAFHPGIPAYWLIFSKFVYVKIHFVVFGYMLRVTYAPPDPLVQKFYHQK